MLIFKEDKIREAIVDNTIIYSIIIVLIKVLVKDFSSKYNIS